MTSLIWYCVPNLTTSDTTRIRIRAMATVTVIRFVCSDSRPVWACATIACINRTAMVWSCCGPLRLTFSCCKQVVAINSESHNTACSVGRTTVLESKCTRSSSNTSPSDHVGDFRHMVIICSSGHSSISSSSSSFPSRPPFQISSTGNPVLLSTSQSCDWSRLRCWGVW